MTYLVLLLSIMSTFLLALGHDWDVTTIMAVGTLLASLAYLVLKAEGGGRQAGELAQLRSAYDQLDQQAKLIIRTDLELHRAQEELDRRLASLMSLHRLGQ